VRLGLNPGDKVIVEGLQKVFMPGMPVNAKTVAMTATPPLTDPLPENPTHGLFPFFHRQADFCRRTVDSDFYHRIDRHPAVAGERIS
jgi:hypothetical protein